VCFRNGCKRLIHNRLSTEEDKLPYNQVQTGLRQDFATLRLKTSQYRNVCAMPIFIHLSFSLPSPLALVVVLLLGFIWIGFIDHSMYGIETEDAMKERV